MKRKSIFKIIIVIAVFIILFMIIIFTIAVFKDTYKSKTYELDIQLKSNPYNIYDVEHEILEYVYKYSKYEKMSLDYVVYFMSKNYGSYAKFYFCSDKSKGIMTTVTMEITKNKNAITNIYCRKGDQVRTSSGGVKYVNIFDIYNDVLADSKYNEILVEDPIRIRVEKDDIYIMNIKYEK